MSSALQLVFLLASLFSLSAGTDRQSLNYSIVPRQEEVNTCGFAIAAGILAAVSGDALSAVPDEASLTADYARHDTRGSPESSTLLDLLKIFAQNGVTAIPFSGSSEDATAMLSQGIPLVTHLKSPTEHFILALGLSQDGIDIADPDAGFQIMPMDNFSARISGFFIAIPDLRSNAGFWDSVSTAHDIALRQISFLSRLSGGGIVQKPAARGKAYESAAAQRASRKSSLGFSVALFGSAPAAAANTSLSLPAAGEVSAHLDGRLSSAFNYGALLAFAPGYRYRFSASLAFRLDSGNDSARSKKACFFKAGTVLETRKFAERSAGQDGLTETTVHENSGEAFGFFAEPFLEFTTSSVSEASLVKAGFAIGASLASGREARPFLQADAGTILALSADLALQAGLNLRLKTETESDRKFAALSSYAEFGIHIPADRVSMQLLGSLYTGVRLNLGNVQDEANAIIVRWQL